MVRESGDLIDQFSCSLFHVFNENKVQTILRFINDNLSTLKCLMYYISDVSAYNIYCDVEDNLQNPSKIRRCTTKTQVQSPYLIVTFELKTFQYAI